MYHINLNNHLIAADRAARVSSSRANWFGNDAIYLSEDDKYLLLRAAAEEQSQSMPLIKRAVSFFNAIGSVFAAKKEIMVPKPTHDAF